MSDDDRLLVTLAERSLQRLDRIADTVSLAAALDSRTLELRLWPVNLVEILRAAAAVAAALEPRREVEVAFDLPADPCPVRADEERLARAVSELLINAVRHARRRVRFSLELAARMARVAIEDDGEGVSEETRPTLFRRFAPRSSQSSLGMGLSVAHDVIVAHGGRLELEASKLPPGRLGTTGARFVISLAIDCGA
jgi:signal transduction histidine kinase